MAAAFVVGVDVGTGSARAALVDCANGHIVRIAHAPIATYNPPATQLFHQSSDNIWRACAQVVKEVTSSVDKELVKGIAFDATCSLVVLDRQGQPLSVSPHGESEQNVILWLDHRASTEVNLINKTEHKLLSYVGGKMSLEMQLPKLLWLKNNLRDNCWNKAGYFFDLADFLTWKATGSDARSICTVTCKWAYDGVSNSWDKSFMESIGLDDLLEDGCSKIGSVMQAPGIPCGQGLTESAAADFGLKVGTCVATSIIDAHAGVLGMAAARLSEDKKMSDPTLEFRLSLICGTSTCLMAVGGSRVFVAGVWGPYPGAVLGLEPHLWLLEGGQSATGKLIDHLVDKHPASSHIRTEDNVHITDYLNELLKKMAERRHLSSVEFLTKDLHVWPDFHGNRSPLADPSLRGMMSGLSLSTSEEDLALQYLAAIQSLAYSTKQIISSMESAGHAHIETVLACGGLAHNSLYVQVLANVLACQSTRCQLLVPVQQNATATGHWPSVSHAMTGMAPVANEVQAQPSTYQYHSKKYKVFLQMVEDQKKYKRIMDS
ncbi:FGGY carbohydrate kinase domain-containing protein [Nilaparvata lugens]|uniref:FGGY carbohydrate kinase domain-containing protein n=1 Tax=Nilaparvata lugens TaxID=108931 RepID=UPI00193D26C5|nr:FGGY carbohydrate kinase domain-containing protein [Nilaparvata lugens]XP_039274927.1 FGGY carbohydrate kinase domain-containing protein [Nilaparvata lugens]XP_039274928.1 FGGY carbohydrate kinase domain-containing protein [Nilaparvata lugens]XP_039274929.1 FGGY carbohydrate kinase domain-containing protein [Nilaparvata lugens]